MGVVQSWRLWQVWRTMSRVSSLTFSGTMAEMAIFVRHSWLVVCAICLVGCGGSSGGYSGATGMVSGQMVIDGKPLREGCLVAFQASEEGFTATGVVKQDGKYTLTYNGSFQIPAVKYRIQLSPPSETPEFKPAGSEKQDPTSMALKVMGPPGSAKVKEAVKPPFPPKYSSAITSGIEYTVKEGQNTADFDLSP